MEIKRLEDIKEPPKNTIITIGNFDGVHLGHQKIIREVVLSAKRHKGTSVVMTFDPHPVKFFHPERDFHLLTLCDEKAKIIEKLGVDILLCVRFDRNFASLMPENFIKDILVDKLQTKEIIIGPDYRFGKGKKGDIELLKKEGKKYGFGVKIIKPVKMKGEVISSTKLRNLIKKGDVKKAGLFLGRPYTIEGTVVKGTGRGSRLLGFPTANILSGAELIPKEGVYAVKVSLEEVFSEKKGRDILLDGVMNIGTNPTFGNNTITLEVHILDFHEDILNRLIKVYFIERLRNEKRFPSLEGLKRAIEKDIEKAREILKKDRLQP
jgi:riboflavin kinase/FMN adenylyltransferase